MVGGYKLIDFKSKNITQEGVKIEGISKSIREANKMLISANLTVTDITLKSIQLTFVDVDGVLISNTFKVADSDITITITTDDTVTIM
jgi:hypothetical protein